MTDSDLYNLHQKVLACAKKKRWTQVDLNLAILMHKEWQRIFFAQGLVPHTYAKLQLDFLALAFAADMTHPYYDLSGLSFGSEPLSKVCFFAGNYQGCDLTALRGIVIWGSESPDFHTAKISRGTLEGMEGNR